MILTLVHEVRNKNELLHEEALCFMAQGESLRTQRRQHCVHTADGDKAEVLQDGARGKPERVTIMCRIKAAVSEP